MHAIFRGLTVLWLAALGAGAAAAPTTRAVSEREVADGFPGSGDFRNVCLSLPHFGSRGCGDDGED